MTWALCWKEYREQRWLWLLIAGLTTFLVVGLSQALAPGGAGSARLPEQVRASLTAVVLVMAVSYGLVCGSVLLAGERESGTQKFLDVLSAARGPVWRAKALAGAGLTLAQALLLLALVPPFDLDYPRAPGAIFWLLPALALEGYACGLAASPAMPSGFLAAVAGSILLGPAFVVAASPLAGTVVQGPGALLAAQAAIALGALGLSYWGFCEPDRCRRAPATPWRPRQRTEVRRAPGWLTLLWLTKRQGKTEALMVLVAAVPLGALLALVDTRLVCVAALLAGVVCGTAVFADEQAGGSFRFLGNQRLPLGRVWTLRILCWFLCAVGAAGTAAIGAATLEVARAEQRSARQANDDLLGQVLAHTEGPGASQFVLLAFAVTHGFAVGQLTGLLCRRRLAAVVIAGFAAPALTLVWVPSLLLGGLHLWQLFGPPLFLLAAGRLVVWPWASERLRGRQPVVRVLGCALLAGVWIGGSLWWRVGEVPDVGAPFDRKAFSAELSEAEKSEAGELIREASRELLDDEKRVVEKLGPPKKWKLGPAAGEGPAEELPNARAPGPADWQAAYQDLSWEVSRSGWPKDAGDLERWLDRLFAGEWAGKVRSAVAAPLGLVDDPRRSGPYSLAPHLTGAREAGNLFVARGLQLQSRGEHAAALEHLMVALGLSWQLRNHTDLLHAGTGKAVQDTALHGLDRWLENLGPRKDLLDRTARELQRHEQQLPQIAEAVKAEYYAALNRIDAVLRPGGGLRSHVYALARQIPWERERERRLLDVFFVHELRRLDLPYWEIELRRSGAASGVVAAREGRPQRDLERYLEGGPWASALCDSFQARLLPALATRPWVTGKAIELTRLRASRLCVALARYEAETGKLADKLVELVPRYLKEVPVDPFNGEAFHYRVSKGERIDGWPEGPDSEERPRAVPPGQGILWSVGLDGNDNGGRKQGYPRGVWDPQAWADQGLDMIFLVPHWPKR